MNLSFILDVFSNILIDCVDLLLECEKNEEFVVNNDVN